MASRGEGVDSMRPLTEVGRVDEACDRFEAEWRRGPQPRIEDYLAAAEDGLVPALLDELLAVELELRQGRGERPALEEYLGRFPGHAPVVDRAFARAGVTVARGAATPTVAGPARDPGELPTDRPGRREPDAAGRFRAVRLHARGGLGEVFIARDLELDRQVALKRIRDAHADDPQSRARFVREARLTGRLEHPGIVPVYGLGADRDGQPYYAMRLIGGESLQAAVDRLQAAGADRAGRPDARELRRLLERFVDACNAVAYAHSRGVVHRDLKPANVMLGPFGETLVVDWGLAKPLGEPEEAAGPAPVGSATPEPTLEGWALGTPGFMSPEQAAGAPERVGPASDIYSLGATLYCILTGRPPFQGRDLADLLGRVRRGDFPPPRAAAPRSPPALAAICLKAMALEPAARYESAAALGEAIEHWLADEPVAAYREPLPARLGRWGRRHRPAVAAAAALLVTAVVGLAISTALIGREQARTRAQREEAIRQRDRAAESFREARAAVDDYLTRVSESKLLNVPGLQPLRRELLEAALGYYEGFVGRVGADPALRADLAGAYFRTGSINSLLGSKERALEAYRRAIALYEGLARDRDDRDGAIRRELAGCLHNLGVIGQSLGHRDEALRSFERALRIRDELLRAHPGDPRFVKDLAGSRNNLGMLLAALGRPEDGLRQLELACGLRDALARAHPDEPAYRAALASTLGNLAIHQRALGREDEALAALEQARDLAESVIREEPEDVDARGTLAEVYGNLAILRRRRGEIPGALRSYGRALAIQDRLAREHPAVVRHRRQLAFTHYNLGNLYHETGRPVEALEAYRRSSEVMEGLVSEHPGDPEFRSDLAGCEEAVGDRLLEAGRATEALDWYRRAAARREALAGAAPDDADGRLALAEDLGRVGRAMRRLGRRDEAEATLRRALAVAGAVAGPAAPDSRHGLLLAGLPVDLAACLASPARGDEAIQLLRQAVAAGLDDRGLLADPAFDSLRDRHDFRALGLDLGFPSDPFAE